jgi:hypothetical protein
MTNTIDLTPLTIHDFHLALNRWPQQCKMGLGLFSDKDKVPMPIFYYLVQDADGEPRVDATLIVAEDFESVQLTLRLQGIELATRQPFLQKQYDRIVINRRVHFGRMPTTGDFLADHLLSAAADWRQESAILNRRADIVEVWEAFLSVLTLSERHEIHEVTGYDS